MSAAVIEDLPKKLSVAKDEVLHQFGNSVAAIMVMGSVTREPTAASDLDVSVIFRDRDYNERVEQLRETLAAIAKKINDDDPHHALALWATKEDHYRTLLPDVSYVRRNLPYASDRLDAWCGLAKLTLAFYEAASARVIHGEFDPSPRVKRIPKTEAVELFLLSTRTLAEGVAELASDDVGVRRLGRNHVAKAGLRAAYAVTIARGGQPLNSYREILDGASRELPESLRPSLGRLFKAKAGTTDAVDVDDALHVMTRCEREIATVARMPLGGLTRGREGESFAFPFEALTGALPDVKPESYRRFPVFESNYVHSLYFLLTAPAILRRLAGAGAAASVLEFYFEEIMVVATYSLFNPLGLRLLLGSEKERSSLTIGLGADAIHDVVSVLSDLVRQMGKASSKPAPGDTPWLPAPMRFALARGLAQQLAGAGFIRAPSTLATFLDNTQIDDLIATLRWQSDALRGVFSDSVLEMLNKIALTLYQSGRNDDARALLEGAVLMDRPNSGIESTLNEGDVARLRTHLSTTRQYLGITYHRDADVAAARREYLRALELNPDNFSALDDFTQLLLDVNPSDETAELLQGLVALTKAHTAEARRGLADRFMTLAIDLKRAGALTEAERWYRHAAKADAGYAKPPFNHGLLLDQRGEFEAARDLYERSIALDPSYQKPYMQLALMWENGGDLRNSIETLNRAIQQGLNDERISTNLGNVYLKAGDLEAAKRSFTQACEFNEGFADAWNGRGLSVLLREAVAPGELGEALIWFKRAMELDPSFDGARMNYSRALARLPGGEMR